MRWLGFSAVLAVSAAWPLLAPAAWSRGGPFPDAAVLLVVYSALRGGAERAALVGVGVGLAGACLSSDPPGQQAFLLGAAGWLAGGARRAVFRDRLLVQMAIAAAATLLARAGGAVFAAMACRPLPGLPGPAPLGWLVPGLLAAAATALAVPPGFGLLRLTGALAPVERGRWRDV